MSSVAIGSHMLRQVTSGTLHTKGRVSEMDAKVKLVALAAASVFAVACGEAPAAVAPPPPEVYVMPVVQKDVPTYLELVGQTRGFQDVEVRARVEGFLERVHFQEGSLVRAGAPLYDIDRKPLEAVVAAAKADQATAEARLAKAENDVARYTPLVARQAVSQRELDDARAERDAARSQVDAAKAAVEKATLDQGYTRIFSPISGLAGTTQVKAGNLVGRGENTLLTTISQINPMIFEVGVTEADYLRIARRGLERGKAGRGSAAPVEGIELTLADGTKYPQTGKVGPVERAVDATTGTLSVQIIFPNPDLILRPGQFGRAKALLEMKPGAMLVPQRAVQELQNLYSVAVVDDSNKVSFRNVKVGPRVESMWVIEEGLKPGERVVVEGLQRVQDGMTVAAKAPPAASTPGATQPVQTAGEAK
jgi:membrane fusion protein, multidrug efflux system